MFLGWPGNALGFLLKSWKKWLGRGKSGPPFLSCCPRDPTPDKRRKMDGWMEYQSPESFKNYFVIIVFL